MFVKNVKLRRWSALPDVGLHTCSVLVDSKCWASVVEPALVWHLVDVLPFLLMMQVGTLLSDHTMQTQDNTGLKLGHRLRRNPTPSQHWVKLPFFLHQRPISIERVVHMTRWPYQENTRKHEDEKTFSGGGGAFLMATWNICERDILWTISWVELKFMWGFDVVIRYHDIRCYCRSLRFLGCWHGLLNLCGSYCHSKIKFLPYYMANCSKICWLRSLYENS